MAVTPQMSVHSLAPYRVKLSYLQETTSETNDEMRAVVFEAPGQVRVDERALPTIQEPGDVVVRVTTGAICGTDLHFYHGRVPLEQGAVVGHEFVGVVEEAGQTVQRFQPGDRVVGSFTSACGMCWFCRRNLFNKCTGARIFGCGFAFGDLAGSQADFVLVPNADHNLLPVPEELSDEQALFAGDIFTTGYYCAREGGVKPGDTVAVVGCGPVGIFAQMSARVLGAAVVYGIDMVPARLKLAESIGSIPINAADQDPLDVILDATDWRGADVTMECVGNEAALETALRLVRPVGTVSVVGVFLEDRVGLPLGDLWIKNVTLKGGVCNVQRYWEETMSLIKSGRVDPTVIISHTLPLEDAAHGYTLFDTREATKVILKP